MNNQKPVYPCNALFDERKKAQHHPRDLDEKETLPPPIAFVTTDPRAVVKNFSNPDAVQIGKLTSEAMRQAHEQAAKEFEELGNEINTRMVKLEELKLEAKKQIDEVLELARVHRDAGQHMAAQILSAAADLQSTRETIDEMKKKVSLP